MAKKDRKPKEMRATRNRVKGLGAVEFLALQEFSHRAKNLENCGLYVARQAFFKGKTPDYYKIYEKLKSHADYKLMHSQTGQQTLMIVHQNMKSFNANRNAAKNEGRGRRVRLPGYKDKQGFSNLRFAKQSFSVIKNQVRLSLPQDFRELFGTQFLFFGMPPHITERNLKMVELIPFRNGKLFTISFIHEYEVKSVPRSRVSKEKYLSIDLGVNNLAAILNSVNGEARIFCGRKIKSLNHRYNKEKARLQSIMDLHNDEQKWSARLQRMTMKRDDQIEDQFHKISAKIVACAVKHAIGTIVIGKNPNWKQDVDLGKRNNQNFVHIPHSKLIHYITYKAAALGIEVVEQEESYTSKCDALSNEEIKKHKSYSGRRVKRGLFKSSTGKTIHSDVNGCLNILRKFLQGKCNDKSLVKGIVDKGLVFRPQMLTISSGSLVL